MKKTIRENVEALLAKYEEARADDKLLFVMYWKEVDGVDLNQCGAKTFMLKATLPESIRRQRQLIQQDGKFLPSEEVLEARAERRESMRQSLGKRRKAV